MIPPSDSLFFLAFIPAVILYWFFVRPTEHEDYLLFVFTTALAVLIVVVSNILLSFAAFMTVACISTLFRKYFYIYLAGLLVILGTAALCCFSQLSDFVLAVSVAGIIGVTFSRNLRQSIMGNEVSKGKNSSIEGKRDLFQIMSGVIMILLVMFAGRFDYLLIMAITLILFGLGNYASTGHSEKVRTFFYGMERQATALGTGAIMIASGTLFMVALLPVNAILLTAIFVVLIGDSLSSLFGMRYPIARLPFNRNKSVGGFLAILLPSLLFAYLISGCSIGFPIAIAVLGAIVESLTFSPLDDNITVPFSMVLLYLLIFS